MRRWRAVAAPAQIGISSSKSGGWLGRAIGGDPLPALPWFRSQTPRVPTEIGRYLGFAATTRWMALHDALG
mgnify:CR=1 FL=1